MSKLLNNQTKIKAKGDDIDKEMNHAPHGTQQKPGKQSKQQHPVQDQNHNHIHTELRKDERSIFNT